MPVNLQQYKNDLDALLKKGQSLEYAMLHDCEPSFVDTAQEQLGDKAEKFLASLPSFTQEYQTWYSEASVLIKQLLPDRLGDFIRHYEKPKSRKEISFESYRIEDYLQGLNVTSGWGDKVVGPDAAIPHFRQQLAIVKSVERRFESSLFDIRQIVQADLFDTELESGRELLKAGFLRAAGMIAGVVLEKHLAQVCSNHDLTTRKNRPTISDFYQMLKDASVIDIPTWRQMQRLGDLRNLCAHNGDREPTSDEVEELISSTEKFCKSLF